MRVSNEDILLVTILIITGAFDALCWIFFPALGFFAPMLISTPIALALAYILPRFIEKWRAS